ncbi:unnamed protein product, partial [Tenebrio molitor]
LKETNILPLEFNQITVVNEEGVASAATASNFIKCFVIESPLAFIAPQTNPLDIFIGRSGPYPIDHRR